MPKKRFWRVLEEMPGQKAPLAVWRNRLGYWPQFDQLQHKYLLITGQRAASIECPTLCWHACPRHIVEYTPSDIEALCPEQEAPPIRIADKDLLVYGLKQSAIMKAVCDAIGIQYKPFQTASCHSSWRIGDFIPLPGASVPVYMSIQKGFDELDRVVKYLCLLHSDPIVLMAPTRRMLSADTEQILEQHKSVFMAMEEALVFTETWNLQISCPKGFLFRKLLPKELRTTPTDPLPQNVFRQCGSDWQIRFQGGEAVYLDRQKGVEYLTFLLDAPYKPISVLELYHNGVMDEQTRNAMKASGFELADEHYLEQCRNQIGELNRGIIEAEQFNDPGRRVRLQREKDQLLKQIRGLIGPGGTLRQSDDPIKKPRDAVSKAIRRTIKNIRNAEMSRFADHLEKRLVFGKDMMYNPPNDIYWETRPIVE